MEFVKWGKISRWNKNWEITEKIDGTNGVLMWTDVADTAHRESIARVDDLWLYAGSRNRWLSPDADNYGFAAWAAENAEALRVLGKGRHFGEWYGLGIQRGYGMTEKRFALFNTKDPDWIDPDGPNRVDIVPVIHATTGHHVELAIHECLYELRTNGSIVAPGFAEPEGIVVRNVETSARFKVLLENDNISKSEAGVKELQHVGS